MHLRTNTHMTFEINKIQVFIFSPRNTEIKIWNLKKLWASILLFWLLEQTTATDKVEPPSVMAPDQKKKSRYIRKIKILIQTKMLRYKIPMLRKIILNEIK